MANPEVTNTNFYDVLISLGPSIVVAIISWLSIRTNYKRQRLDNQKDTRVNKIEIFYEKLIKINGVIQGKINSINNKNFTSIGSDEISEIIKDIESLNIEAKIYLDFYDINNYRRKASKLLNIINKCKCQEDYDKIVNDGYTEEVEPEIIITIQESTLFQSINDYHDRFKHVETHLLNLARKELGLKKIRKVKRKKMKPRSSRKMKRELLKRVKKGISE